jgi:hypothetical protein
MSAGEKSSPARLIVLDLIAFVLMASGMGLITAIALAAVALLFASHAQASEAREPTIVVRRLESQQAMCAPLQSAEVASRAPAMVLPAQPHGRRG